MKLLGGRPFSYTEGGPVTLLRLEPGDYNCIIEDR